MQYTFVITPLNPFQTGEYILTSLLYGDMQNGYTFYSFLKGLAGLLLISIILVVPATSTTENISKQENPMYVITNISILETNLIVSPGINVSPSVTIQNIGGEPKTDSAIRFKAVIGPVTLIPDSISNPAPHAGETKTFSLSFIVPSILPGEYPLEIFVSSEKDNNSNSWETSMKSHKNIHVTQPGPGSGRDCGCS